MEEHCEQIPSAIWALLGIAIVGAFMLAFYVLYQNKEQLAYRYQTIPILKKMEALPVEHLLTDINTTLKNKEPEGKTRDMLLNITDAVYMHTDEKEGGLNWTTCSILNSGPNNVYFAINEWEQPTAPLLPGESINIDFERRGAIKKIWLICDTGETAQVRIYAIK